MNLSKLFLFYTIVISSLSYGMELEIDRRGNHRLTAQVDNDEYVVLFRGFHFGAGMNAQARAAIDYWSSQEVGSRYTDLSTSANNNIDRRPLDLKQLARLRASGPHLSRDQQKQGSAALPYPSAYHWILELYVNQYKNFKEQLSDRTSELTELLNKYELHFDDIFFVSTSLNCETAVKYALGLCSGNYKNWPDWQPQAKNVQATLGYLDIFVIPRRDLEALGVFPVVEEFSLHTIKLPYASDQKNYTVAEEFVFPLSIPNRYHKKRVAITIEKKRESKKAEFMTDYMRRQAKSITKKLNEQVSKLVALEKGQRTFLYLLNNRLEDGQGKLAPKDAVALKEKVNPLLIKTYEEVKKSGRSLKEEVTLPSCIAIERTIDAFDSEFSFQSNDFSDSLMHHMAALVKHRSLSRVILGSKRDEVDVAKQCLGMGSWRYDSEPKNFDSVVRSAAKRSNPITFVMAFIVAPEYRKFLDHIEESSKRKIRFEYDRQNYDAQQYECIEAEALPDLPDDLEEVLFPTCSSVKQIVEDFVAVVENLVYEFSSALGECKVLSSFDSGYALEEELLIDDNDRPDTYLPGEAIDYLDKYQQRVQKLDFDDLFDELLWDEPEAAGDLFYAYYEEAEEKFSNKVTELIKKTSERLEDMVEYLSGEEEESGNEFDDGESSSAVSHKRGPTRSVPSLQAEFLDTGYLLKKRAVNKENYE